MAAIEQQIRNRFNGLAEAWNRGDLDAYLAGYWDSQETRYVSRGTLIRGVDAIRAAYKSIYDSPEKMGKVELQDLEIDILTDDDALVVGTWSHTVGELVRHGVFTVQIKKHQREWFVVMDHTSASI